MLHTWVHRDSVHLKVHLSRLRLYPFKNLTWFVMLNMSVRISVQLCTFDTFVKISLKCSDSVQVLSNFIQLLCLNIDCWSLRIRLLSWHVENTTWSICHSRNIFEQNVVIGQFSSLTDQTLVLSRKMFPCCSILLGMKLRLSCNLVLETIIIW